MNGKHQRVAAAILMPIVAVSCSVFKGAEKKKQPPATNNTIAAAVKDSAKGPVGYDKLITKGTITRKGLFTVHENNGKFLFELADSVFGRDILLVNRMSRSTPGAGNFGGEAIGERILQWEKGPDKKVFLRVITMINTADSTNMISRAVQNSNLYPIAAAFDIKAFSKDSSSVVIDVTDFIKGDQQLLGFTPGAKRAYSLTNLAPDRSYVVSVNSYPINTEIRTVKTYNATPPADRAGLPAVAEAGAVTLELNNSFILLPQTPMRKRYFDYRVGYFASEYNLFTDAQQRVESEAFIHRWRLEPKPEDQQKWLRGELVEPQKKIVYYIDPATPKKWRPYLIAGINDWNKAFEQAGFKNAIEGKEWPENDTTMSLEDARFSVIRYYATAQKNAYGPNIADPRSGEIIESHIGWYHNVMTLVHDWYMIQAGAIDKRAQKMVFDDALMGQLIRFVSSHEVGHTLGLRHNMGASSATPVEKLRDKKWVETHGHTASIMDYARFNYVAQPEDNIGEAGIFPRINDYDTWAIQWGYGPTPAGLSKEQELSWLNKQVMDSLKSNYRLAFYGEGKDYDPRSQTEDLGDNSMKASEYGIKNLKRIVPNLLAWTKENDYDGYVNLYEMFKQVIAQFERYNGHVLKNLAGVPQTARSTGEPGNLYAYTPKAVQREAIAYFNKHVFETPYWLLDTNILNKINNPAMGDPLPQLQSTWLMLVTSGGRLTRLGEVANRFRKEDVHTPEELLIDVEKGLWSELETGKEIDYYRRKLHRAYIANLIGLVDPDAIKGGMEKLIASMSAEAVSNSDVKSLARKRLVGLQSRIRKALNANSNPKNREHLDFLLHTLNKMLDEKP